MAQYLKVGILSMNAEGNYLLHRVALHACRINLHAYGDTGSNNIVVFLTIQYYCLSLRHE